MTNASSLYACQQYICQIEKTLHVLRLWPNNFNMISKMHTQDDATVLRMVALSPFSGELANITPPSSFFVSFGNEKGIERRRVVAQCFL